MFNLSFESLTSREALHALRDVQKNDVKTWEHIKTAQYRVEIPQADEEVEPPFMLRMLSSILAMLLWMLFYSTLHQVN